MKGPRGTLPPRSSAPPGLRPPCPQGALHPWVADGDLASGIPTAQTVISTLDSTSACRHILDIVLFHPGAQVNLVCAVVDLEGNRGEGPPGHHLDLSGCPRTRHCPGRAPPPPQHLRLPHSPSESCWPAIRTMMEMTCHRRDLILNSFSTEMKPAAFSPVLLQDLLYLRVHIVPATQLSQPAAQ